MRSNPNSQYIKHFGQDHDSRFSPGLQKLVNEHGPLLSEIGNIIQKVEWFEGDIDEWKEIVHQHKTFVTNLERHSEKEENTVFQIMKGYIGTTSGPIEIMEEEHEEISNNLNSFQSHASELQDAPSSENISDLLLFLEQALEVMQQHFYKEEHAIYPMAEQLLSDEEKNKLSLHI